MAYKNNKAGYENTLLGVLFLTFGFVFFDRLALSFLFRGAFWAISQMAFVRKRKLGTNL